MTNLIVNRGGIAFVYMLQEEIGETAPDIVRSFMVACKLFYLQSLFYDIEAFDNQITASVQLSLMRKIRQHIERASRWLLHHHHMPLSFSRNLYG